MNLKYIKSKFFLRSLLIVSGFLCSQNPELKLNRIISLSETSNIAYGDLSPLLYYPFPQKQFSLVQSLDSTSFPKGLVKLNLGNNQYIVELADNW